MIIGLSGQAGSGKDTVADLLGKEHGFVTIALADPMKRFCMEVFNFSEEQLWGPSEKRNEPDERYPTSIVLRKGLAVGKSTDSPHGVETKYLTPRHALQQLGTGWGRACYEDVWVNYALRVVEDILEEGWHYNRTQGSYAGSKSSRFRGVVIADCRFKNEFDAIRKAGGKLVRIIRPGAGLEGAQAQHQSEAEQREVPDDFFDFILDNSSSFHDLATRIDSMMDRFNGRLVPYDPSGNDDIPPFKRK